MPEACSEPCAESSSESPKVQDTATPHARPPVYWLIPDDNGKPAQTGAIPVFSAEQLNTLTFPVMPMYDLKVAAALIPMGDKGLMAHLMKNKAHYPARYRRVQRDGRQRRIRLLSASEVQSIREEIFLGPGKGTIHRLA